MFSHIDKSFLSYSPKKTKMKFSFVPFWAWCEAESHNNGTGAFPAIPATKIALGMTC
jgi:hypothetical protein